MRRTHSILVVYIALDRVAEAGLLPARGCVALTEGYPIYTSGIAQVFLEGFDDIDEAHYGGLNSFQCCCYLYMR